MSVVVAVEIAVGVVRLVEPFTTGGSAVEASMYDATTSMVAAADVMSLILWVVDERSSDTYCPFSSLLARRTR